MRIKRKNLPLLPSLAITDAGTEGQSVGKLDELVVFVSGAVPGDTVSVQLTRKKKNYAEGRVTEVLTYSDKRSAPFCKHFGSCGGCKWQNMAYDWQLHFKQKQVEDSLRRIGHLALPPLDPIIASGKQQYYRNKLEYTFSNKKWLTKDEMDKGGKEGPQDALGFHLPKMFDKILDIEECFLQAEPSNTLRNALKAFALTHHLSFYDIRSHKGLLRNVIIRTSSTNQLMVIVCFGEDDKTGIELVMRFLLDRFTEITALLYVVNLKLNDTIADQEVITYHKADHIVEQMEGINFRISPKSFYQTNSEQAYALYQIARKFAGLTGTEIVYDLYTGTGTIANFIASKAKKVIGIEYVEDAIADAKLNSQLNGITNTLFYAGDMKDVLTAEFIEAHGKADVIVTDPPRSGMHEQVVQTIITMRPSRIVYVSCNPATQARDLALLAHLYRIVKIQPVDMFPQTHHVENVVLLELTV